MKLKITFSICLLFAFFGIASAQGPQRGDLDGQTLHQTTSEGIVPDTTALRWIAFSDGGEVVFFNNDTTNLIYTEAMVGSGSSYNAVFQHPDGRLIVLIDSTQGDGNRNFYEYEPFMSTRQLIHNTAVQYLAAACVLPNGRVFGMTGNGNSAAGQIWEYDLVNQVDSLFMTIPYSLMGSNPANILYRPSTDELLVFNGGIDSVFVIDYQNKTYQQLAANLNMDNALKATYLDGEKLVMASDALYLGDLSTGYDLTLSPTLLPDYLSDLDNLDLIEGLDTVYVCAGDSMTLDSRYQSLFYHWYLDGVSTGITNASITSAAPGNYRLLVQMDASATKFMWSEAVTVIQTAIPLADISQSTDTIGSGLPVTFENNGTLGGFASWSFGDGSVATGDSVTYSYNTPGIYVITLTVDVNGCTATDYDTIVVVPIISIDPSQGLSNLSWISSAPNPVASTLTLTFEPLESMHAKLEIFDLVGCRIATLHEGLLEAGITRFAWDSNTANSGVYLVKLSTESGQIVRKVVVQH